MASVFISYAREDQPVALRLYHDLERHSHEPWIDKYHIQPGEAWKVASRKALHKASHAVFLFSRRSVSKRGAFQVELKEALEILKEFPEGQVFLIPARLDECEPPAFALREIHQVDLFPDYETGLREIIKVLSGGAPRDLQPDPELVSALQLFRRGIYDEAARRFGALVKRDPERSEPRYYLVLSFLAGKRARLLSSEIVGKLEEHLRIALACDGAPHIRLLSALLKYDCYVLNGLQEPRPTVGELLAGGVKIDRTRGEELRTAFSAPGNPLWESILQDIQ